MNKLIFIILPVFLLACQHKHYTNPHILINTQFGNIEAELFPAKAPKTVAAFLSYIDSGFYTNTSFYRIVQQEEMASANSGIIQGGLWQTNNHKLLSIPGIPHESPAQTGLSHTDGTLSLARTTPGTANTEFFICVGDQTQYDSSTTVNPDGLGFAAFGRVVSGMAIVRKIHDQPFTGDSFDQKINIINITNIK